MSNLRIESLYRGKPEILTDHKGRKFKSSIKRPEVKVPIKVNFSGFVEDLCEFEDHRTNDRAFCFFTEAGYNELEAFYGKEFERPTFGENIRIGGLSDREICIGDQIKIGDVVLEVSHPREPCSNVIKATGLTDLIKVMCKLPTTGFLARVKNTGTMSYDKNIEVIKQPHPGISIHFLNETLYQYHEDLERVQKVLNIPQLADNWKLSLRKRAKQVLKT